MFPFQCTLAYEMEKIKELVLGYEAAARTAVNGLGSAG